MVDDEHVNGVRRRGRAHRGFGEYSRHVGRVGALALAFGVGGALSGGLGTAYAAPDTNRTSSAASSSAAGAADGTGGGAPAPADADSGDPADSPATSSSVQDSASDTDQAERSASSLPASGGAADADSSPADPVVLTDEASGQSSIVDGDVDTSIPDTGSAPAHQLAADRLSDVFSISGAPDTADAEDAATDEVATMPPGQVVVVAESRSGGAPETPSANPNPDDSIGAPDTADTALTSIDIDGAGVASEDEPAQPSLPEHSGKRRTGAAIATDVTTIALADGEETPAAPGSVPVITRVLAGVLGLFGWEMSVGEAPLNPFARDFLTQLAFAASQRVRYWLGNFAATVSPVSPTLDADEPATDGSPGASPTLAVSSPNASGTYTLTGIDFASGLVSGVLDLDPATVARYEISGGLKGTVTLTDNAFEYRPTAQAQQAASAPGAGYEAQYDNFDVLAIGTTGTNTTVHVDVPVLGAPTPAQPPAQPPTDPAPPPTEPAPPPADSSNNIVYKLDMLDFAPFLEGEGDTFGSTLDASTVQQRLDLVAPYTNGIRTFSAYNSKDLVRLAHEMGMTVYAGAWIDAGNDSLVGADGRTQAEVEVDELIDLANKGYVDVAIIGSETIYHGQMSEDRVVELMDRFRAGFTDPDIEVVTALKAETLLNTIPGREGQIDPQKLIDAGDFVYYNTYPFWSGVSIDGALDRLKWEHQQIVAIADGKPVQISETGWPSYTDPANPNGAAVGTPENAQRYFSEVTAWARDEGVFLSWFGSFDLPSRAQLEGPSLAGAYWGIWDHTGAVKAAYEATFTGTASPPDDPAPPPSDPAPPPENPDPPSTGSATYTLTGIDFASGLVSGVLDLDPATITRYEISGGLKGTVTLTDNAFEYRPTAQAQQAASAPGAGYEAQYDNFDVLAIGTTGTNTTVHVDVPVLGAPTPAQPPAPPPTDPAPPPENPNPPSTGSATYTLTGIDFASGLIAGVLDLDPATITRYEISGGLKGTVTLTDNAFEYRPTAQAQQAASAPGAGYEAQYDNFDILAIGTNGTNTTVHVDVPVLGATPITS